MSAGYVMGAAGLALVLGGFVLGVVSAQADPMTGGGLDPWSPALVVAGLTLLVAALAGRTPAPPKG